MLDLVRRGVMRGLDLERRWRVGAYFYSLSVCSLFIFFLESCCDVDGFYFGIYLCSYRRLGNMKMGVRSHDAWHRMCSPPSFVDAPPVLAYPTLTPQAL